MKIDWNEAPEWANYWAMDENGHSYWYECQPYISMTWEDMWDAHGVTSLCDEGYISDNWRASLQVRPVILGPDTYMTVSNPTPSHYNHTLNGVKVDPYKIADIYNITSHPQFHALKKILRAHQPNHKSLEQNIDEAISALQRWKEIINE